MNPEEIASDGTQFQPQQFLPVLPHKKRRDHLEPETVSLWERVFYNEMALREDSAVLTFQLVREAFPVQESLQATPVQQVSLQFSWSRPRAAPTSDFFALRINSAAKR